MKKSKIKKTLAVATLLSAAILSTTALTSCDNDEPSTSVTVDLSQDKTSAISTISSYKNQSNYKEAQKSEIAKIIADATTKINAATSKAAIESIVSETKTKLDAVKTAAKVDEEEATELANAKKTKIAEIDAVLATYKTADYSSDNWTKITEYVTSAKAAVNALTTKAAVEAYSLNTLKDNIKAVKTLATELSEAKTAKLAEIDTVAAKYPETNYRDNEKTARTKAINDAKATVNGYTTIADVNAYTTTTLDATLSALKTSAKYDEEEAAELANAKKTKVAEIDALLATYKTADYSSDNWTKITEYVTSAKAAVNALTTKAAVEAYSLNTLKDNIKAVKTLATELSEAKTAKLAEIETLVATYSSKKYSTAKKETFNSLVKNAKETVNGYTVVADVTAYSIESLKTSLDGVSTAVAGINTVYYDSLQEALTAAVETETSIVLYADSTEDVVVASAQTITLDLNGFKLTNVTSHTIVNNGTLTIKDSSTTKTGVVDCITHGKGALSNNGIVTIESGTFERSLEAGSVYDNDGGNSWYTIQNLGTMTINGGTVKNNGIFSSMIVSGYWAASEVKNPTECKLTITGGTFVGGLYNVKSDDYGNVVVTGGTFEVNENAVGYFLNASKLSISNVTLTREEGKTLIYNWVASGNTTYNLGKTVIGKNVTLKGQLVVNNGAVYEIDESVALDNVSYYHVVYNEEQLRAAFTNEKTTYINVESNISVKKQIVSNQNITLNLNTYTISNSVDIWNADTKVYEIFEIDGGTLTVNASSVTNTKTGVTTTGGIKAKENDCYVFTINGGNLIVNGGEYLGNVSVVYVYKGSATINGGSFDIQQLNTNGVQDEYGALLNCYDANFKNGTATLVVTGGSYKNFDPSNNKAEQASNVSSLLADGYTVTSETYNSGLSTEYKIYTVCKAE